ncbi:hypothetical protein KEM56_005271 [Ascosphaera pollenicola]|nr:hypothetical protein KEM56_005271 [Ascosphaera pollenicola]
MRRATRKTTNKVDVPHVRRKPGIRERKSHLKAATACYRTGLIEYLTQTHVRNTAASLAARGVQQEPDSPPSPGIDFESMRELLLFNDDDEETLNSINQRMSSFEPLKRARLLIRAVKNIPECVNPKPLRFLAVKIAVRMLNSFWSRDNQIDAIHHLLFERSDLILIAKTAFGKSLVLQSISLLRENSLTIGIVPLNQVGREQVSSIIEQGGHPLFLNGDNNNKVIQQQIASGQFTHIFTSPELATDVRFRRILQTPWLADKIDMIVIDEAHFVHHWGDDF